MSYAKIFRALSSTKKYACYLVEHGSKHDKWHSPINNMDFYVPRHRSQEVKPSTLRKIFKDAGIK